MRTIAFDIETVADEALMAKHLPPLDVKCGHLKDPLKIAEKQAEARRKQVEMAALDPAVSRVVSTHFAWFTKNQRSPAIITDSNVSTHPATDADESVTIAATFNLLATFDRVATFNGASFDVPFLLRRALLLGITPPIQIETHKYRVTDGKSNHVDIRRVLAETGPGNGLSDYAPGNLDYWGQLLLGEGKLDGCDGSQVAELFNTGQIERLCQYGEHDAALTLRLYQKLQGFYFI